MTIAESTVARYISVMASPKTGTQSPSGLSLVLERCGQLLVPHWLFYRRLAVNVGIALVVVVLSLGIGMVGYHALEGLSWLRSFGHAAMIFGGMGPYSEPVNDSSKLFEGIYAIYCGLLLIGVTGAGIPSGDASTAPSRRQRSQT